MIAKKILTADMFQLGAETDAFTPSKEMKEAQQLANLYDKIMGVDYKSFIELYHMLKAYDIIKYTKSQPVMLYSTEVYFIMCQEYLRCKVLLVLSKHPASAEIQECLEYASTELDGMKVLDTVRAYLQSIMHPAYSEIEDVDLETREGFQQLKNQYELLKKLKESVVLMEMHFGHNHETTERLKAIQEECLATY